jgi:hypothetical protein|uniref:Uncharacterized protein n=1 Tax=viral metagenome TaxID=1070528 RepID=A0A6C0CYR5_9ZZZZ
MIARSLAKVLENREMNVTGNTWTFLAIQKRATKYPSSYFKPIEKKKSVQKNIWIVANQPSTSTWGTNVEMSSF